MENTQGITPVPSAVEQGGQVNISAGVVDPTQASAVPSDVIQGGIQGVGATQPDEIQRQIQSAVDKQRAQFLAEKYQLEQRLNQLQQAQMEMLQRNQQTAQNPFDPNTQPEQYWDWKLARQQETLLKKAEEAYDQKLMGFLNQAGERQWIEQHPNVDINQVKAFAQSRWGVINPNIQQMNDAVALMNLPSTMAQVAQTQINEIFNQMKQPQGAIPIRGANAAGGVQPQLRYDVLAQQFEQSNGRAYNTWTPEVQQAFDRETWARSRAERKQ
jgi:hypothetical protein